MESRASIPKDTGRSRSGLTWPVDNVDDKALVDVAHHERLDTYLSLVSRSRRPMWTILGGYIYFVPVGFGSGGAFAYQESDRHTVEVDAALCIDPDDT